MKEFFGKTAFITGAGRGFGAGLAKLLHEQGCRVVLFDQNKADLETMVSVLGDGSLAVTGDVTNISDLECARSEALCRFGSIDIVVANAGVIALGSVEHMNVDSFRRVIEVNFYGAMNTLRVMTDLLRARRGYVLVVASMASAIHSPMNSAYAASKAAVEAMADCYRQEVADDGIGVGIIFPTFAATDMMNFALQDELGKRVWGGNKGSFF